MTMPVDQPFNHRHAGLARRNGFLPPSIPVVPVAEDATPLSTIPVLTDFRGEQVPGGTRRIALGTTETGWRIRAEIADSATVVDPALEPGHPRFWMQDHIEFRLLPDPTRDLDQVQVILAASGKVLVSGPGTSTAGVECSVDLRADGWRLDATVPFSATGMGRPQPGDVVRGLVAHSRWGNGWLEPATCTACQLGFAQADRFAEFAIEGDRPVVSLEALALPTGDLPLGGVRPGVVLHNHSESECRGALVVTQESSTEVDSRTQRVPCTLQPGLNTQVAVLALARPSYTRITVAFEPANAPRIDVGSVTLRAGIQRRHAIATDPLRHPYLHVDECELADVREKAKLPAFREVAEQMTLRDKDLEPDDLPDSFDDIPIELRPRDGNWFRVCRESMLRDGEGNRRPAAARIWSLLSEEGKQAVRTTVETVGEDREVEDRLLQAFNEVLARADFYDAAAFETVSIPPAARAALEDPNRDLSERELFLTNRKAFQGAIECVHQFRVEYVGKAVGLLDKWLLGQDRRVIETATRYLDAADRCMILAPEINLASGMQCGALGRAYDAFEPHMTDEEKGVWHRVMRRYLELFLDSSRRGHWDCVCIPNANPVANGGGGQLALALLKEFPEEAAEALWYARRNIWNWLDYCTGFDGGNTEGVQYWQYGTLNFLRFARALERVLGHDDGLLSHPGITKTMNMIRVALSNDGATHGMNDTIPLPVGAPIADFCAGRYGDAFALWYADHCERAFRERLAAGKPGPYRSEPFWRLLARPAVPESFEPPALPEVFVLEDIHYGILRSAPKHDCRLVAGLKGARAPYTHHNQPDTGAFFVHVRGERLMIDPGYYKGTPDCHSLPIIGGVTPHQAVATTGRLTSRRREDGVRALVCDATPAYSGAAERAVRFLVMVGEDSLVVLDDIVVAADKQASVLTQLQCGGVTSHLGDNRRCVANDGETARLRIEALTQDEVEFELHAERSLKDIHWGYSFADCRHFPVTAEYRASADEPFVFVLADVENEAPASRLNRTDGAIEVTVPNGQTIRFVQLNLGWTLA